MLDPNFIYSFFSSCFFFSSATNQFVEHGAQLVGREKAVAVEVKGLEGDAQVFGRGRHLDEARHGHQQVGKLDAAPLVERPDHLLHLVHRRVLVHGLEDLHDLLGCDFAIPELRVVERFMVSTERERESEREREREREEEEEEENKKKKKKKNNRKKRARGIPRSEN